MSDEKRRIKAFFKTYSAVFFAVVGFILWAELSPKPLPTLGRVPPFHFKAENGRVFNSRELAGKVWVADFFYCSCHSSCPLQTADMSGLEKKWEGRPDFDLVSFTLDPKDDTLKVLEKYARDAGADQEQWFFLTGDKADIYRLAQNGFKVTAREDPASIVPDFIHSTRLVLVDKKGMIRGYYDVLEPDEVKQLGSDLGRLL